MLVEVKTAKFVNRNRYKDDLLWAWVNMIAFKLFTHAHALKCNDRKGGQWSRNKTNYIHNVLSCSLLCFVFVFVRKIKIINHLLQIKGAIPRNINIRLLCFSC